MIIGNITTIAKPGKIDAGFILVALLAIGNAAGRIIAGMLSDRIGRLWTMCIIFLFQAGLMMVLRTGLTDMTAFVVVSMLLGFNYGACLSVFPTTVKDNFGMKNFGINYGLVFTAWDVGGFVFPLFAGKLFDAAKRSTGTGSYNEPINLYSAVGSADFRSGRSFSVVLSPFCCSRETHPLGPDTHGCFTLHFADNGNEKRAKSLNPTLSTAVFRITQ